jgi:hypothetical protein
MAAAGRRRRAPRLRTVIPLLDGRSESPWESVLWLLHCVADVEVEPQKKIYDEWGRFVARADLWVIGTRRLHEYDGESHRDREAHRTDLARVQRLVEIDWQRVGFTSPQLLFEAGSLIPDEKCWKHAQCGGVRYAISQQFLSLAVRPRTR